MISAIAAPPSAPGYLVQGQVLELDIGDLTKELHICGGVIVSETGGEEADTRPGE